MSKPARLEKQTESQPFYNSLDAWLQSHAILLLTIAVIILFVLVSLLVGVVFNMISGDHILSMTESNGYYYHLGDL